MLMCLGFFKGGNTNTTGALRETRTKIFTPENGDRPLVPNILILITDGIPTREVCSLLVEQTQGINHMQSLIEFLHNKMFSIKCIFGWL